MGHQPEDALENIGSNRMKMRTRQLTCCQNAGSSPEWRCHQRSERRMRLVTVSVLSVLCQFADYDLK